MKKLKRKKSLLHLCVVIGAIVLFAACDLNSSNDGGVPVIESVRHVHPDSAAAHQIEQVGPGETFVIVGSRLKSAQKVYLNGLEATFNPAFVTNSHMIILVPGDMPFGILDPDSEEMNTIKLESQQGTVTFDFPILPPPPIVDRISYEFAPAGETIRLTGQYLYLVLEIIFPGGIEATDFEFAANGTWLDVVVPDGVAGPGDITITTQAGSNSSGPSATFHDVSGMVCNFDDINPYQWWSATLTDDPSLFPGNIGNYVYMQADGIAGGDWAWWDGGRSINLNPVQWVEPAYLDEPVGNFAMKFDVYVREEWITGTVLIRNDGDWSYIARYEPWNRGSNGVEPYQTDGWKTVTIPLTEFKTDNGEGSSASTLDSLLGNDGIRELGFMLINDSESEIQNFMTAFNNIRVVRISE